LRKKELSLKTKLKTKAKTTKTLLNQTLKQLPKVDSSEEIEKTTKQKILQTRKRKHDLIEEKRRLRWIGGGELILPEIPDPNNNITILASYPEEEISKNKSTQIYAWKYTGGLIGFSIGFIKAIKNGGSIFQSFNLAPYMAPDWKKTDIIIETNYSNKVIMTMETYPNDNNGRIVLCTGHPEMFVFWGGHIEEKMDTSNNNLFDALHYWKDFVPFNETTEDEERYNWWMVRRHVAWASKVVPDNDLPPVYGRSQVCDIYPYNQSTNFMISPHSKYPLSITNTTV